MDDDRGRLRLLLLTNSVQIGGMEEHVRLIAEGLDRSRFHVTVVFPDWDETNEFARRVGEVADDFELITPDRRRGAMSALSEARRLFRFARERRFDVAHLHSTTFTGQQLALGVLRLAGVREVFVTEHLAPETAQPRMQRARRALFTRAITGLVCVSERNRVARARHLYTPNDKTLVVDNGIDVSRYEEPPPDDALDRLRQRHRLVAGEPVVGTAIRLEPGKGVEDLVDGFALLHRTHPTAQLLIVGDGSLRSSLERRVAGHGITASVVFTGFDPDPRALIRLMDVFVLPVPFGSASIGLLEAMAMSRVCVITFGGEGEAVVPGENGLWAEPSNPASIASCVGSLIDDPERRAIFAASARCRVETSFSAEKMNEKLSALYLAAS